jgi:hypothetical protein
MELGAQGFDKWPAAYRRGVVGSAECGPGFWLIEGEGADEPGVADELGVTDRDAAEPEPVAVMARAVSGREARTLSPSGQLGLGRRVEEVSSP